MKHEDPAGPLETYLGISEEGFMAAAQDAVQQYENARGGPPPEPTVLRVVDMYVTVTNPIADYRVVLSTG